MKISVTREHLRNGKPISPGLCPVALALGEQHVGQEFVVFSTHMTCQMGNGRAVFVLPPNAVLNISRFDKGEQVEPYEFELEVEVE